MNEKQLQHGQDTGQVREGANSEEAKPDTTKAEPNGGPGDLERETGSETAQCGKAEAEGDACRCREEAERFEHLQQQWEQERADLVNRMLRLKADFDNYKRRSEAQVETIRAAANQNLLVELLPVIDNFERAIAAAEDDSPYLAGVKMIFDQLMNCLYKEGLTPIDAVGKPFDPNIHEAVSIEGDPGQDLVVIGEIQKGYLYKDRLLRASMVKVAPEQQHEEE
ncbi:MAG: nucleotide exchange factor GrpE [Firmicutes bacterium]|nr:nucleotide exchange factor GrpE [Bacillota bacterium]NLL88352.1 nucleotide exchange factor GrpE [Bacillota bacterium]